MLYKLTDAEGYTYYRALLWGVGVTHTASKGEPKLCSETVIHAYTSPLLAELMDPAHGNYGVAKLLWEADGEVVVSDGLKVGVKSLTTLRQIAVPAVTIAQRVAFAIYSAMEVYSDPSWLAWAERWLSGDNRTYFAARAAYVAARAAYVARAAAYAAADATDVARVAARAAADATAVARAAADAAANVDFNVLAQKAMLVL